MQNESDRYVKKFSTYNHLVVMLFVAFEGYHSIREVVLGLLANAHKLSHLGLSYVVRRNTFSEANQRRSSKVFGDIYMSVYRKYASGLADSRLSDADMKRLYIMDSTTISLFKDILKGVGHNPREGKLVFRGDLMAEVTRRIERWYNVKVYLADKELEKYSFRATFEDDKLEEVLRLLSLTSPIRYKIIPRKVLTDGTYEKEQVTIFLNKQ